MKRLHVLLTRTAHAEGAVAGHGRIEVIGAAFFRVELEPLEGVLVHRSAGFHRRMG